MKLKPWTCQKERGITSREEEEDAQMCPCGNSRVELT